MTKGKTSETGTDCKAIEAHFDPQPDRLIASFAAERSYLLYSLKDRHRLLGLREENTYFMTVSITAPVGSEAALDISLASR